MQTRHTETLVCPAELAGPPPAKPAVPAGAELTGNTDGLDWVGRLARWGEALFDLLTGARERCPSVPAAP